VNTFFRLCSFNSGGADKFQTGAINELFSDLAYITAENDELLLTFLDVGNTIGD
jgi:hypothetical protein